MKGQNIRKAAIPVILVVFSTTLTYVFLELLFPFLLLFLPLKTHWCLDEGIRSLAQYSKKGTAPEDYIAIMGDSFAAGKGDWYLEANRNRRQPYHTAHVIHESTGKDVVSFGASGAGSLRGLVAEPISQYEFINATSMFEIKPPDTIMVYFYEGNDLNDNIKDIRLRYENEYDLERIYDEDYFREFIREAVHHKDPVSIRARESGILKELFLGKFIFEQAKQVAREVLGRDHEENIPPQWAYGDINQVEVNGDAISVPDGLQSPALELTDEEIRLAVYVFERSLAYLGEYFPSAKIGVVYIPSPISSYNVVSDKVKIQTYEGRADIYESVLMRKRSDEIASMIEEASRKNNIKFLDSREIIKDNASREILHGPKDWKHFNKKGYSVLSQAVIGLIESMD